MALMTRLFVIAATMLMLVGGIANQAGAGPVYDAVNDFSLASNPNGAWSYGSLSSLTSGTFTAFTQTTMNDFFQGEQGWYNALPVPNDEEVIKNASGTSQSFNTEVLPTNLLNLDGESGIVDVRWTAPTTGVYNISGLFQRVDYGGVSVSVRVLLNGTSLFAADNFRTYNSQQVFNFSNMTLSAGSVLDFAEGAPQFNNDSTGLSVTISSTVPEPSSLVMVGTAGVFGMGCSLRRRRQVGGSKQRAQV